MARARAAGPGWALVLALAVVFGGAGRAEAHVQRVKRALMLEPAADGQLHVLASLHVPSAQAGQPSFAALFDADHDGKLSEAERAELKAALVRRALDGVLLQVGTATAALGGLEAKLELARGACDLVVHGAIPLGLGAQKLTVRTSAGSDPLSLRVLPGPRPVAISTRGTQKDGGLVVELKAPDRVTFKIAALHAG